MCAERPAPSQVVAVVAGRPITLLELSQWLRLADIDPDKAGRQDWQDALGAAIDRAVLIEAGKTEKIGATDEEVARAIEARRSGPEADEYLRRVRLLELTESQERDRMREQLLIDGLLMRKLGSALFVAPSAVAEWYEKNKDLLAGPEVRVARVITVRRAAGGGDPKAQFAEISKRLAAGEDFAALAKAHSADPWAEKGGLMPPLRGRDCGSIFAERVFGLAKAGDVSDVFETDAGVHILKLEGIRPPVVPSFEQAREAVHQRLLDELRAKHIPPVVQELRLRTTVTIFWQQLPKNK